MGMSGTYREIAAPERFAHTEIFDQDWTDGQAEVSTVLTEQDGRTTVTNTILYRSQEVRDLVRDSGMEQGVAASYDRLAALLTADPNTL